jgi:DNA-binding GntR family transcriptional regulator
MAELCTVREELESVAARLGAVSRSELDSSALEQFLAENVTAAEDHDVPGLIHSNHLFHETIWQTARNRYLARQPETLRGLIERRGGQSTLTDHDRQIQALRTRRSSERSSTATRTPRQMLRACIFGGRWCCG